MVGNSILDQVIEQARQRNAQTAAAQQARMATMPQSVAPIVNPILENLDGGGMESMAPNVTQTPQQAYNSAVAFQQSPMSYVSPVMSVMSDYSRHQAAQNPNVQVNVAQPYGAFGRAMGYQDAPKSVTNWAQNNPQIAPEANAAWNAKRAEFMQAEQKAEDAKFADTFGGSYGGSVNGGAAAGSAGEWSGFDSASFDSIGVGGIDGGSDGGDSGGFGSSDGDADAGFSSPF